MPWHVCPLPERRQKSGRKGGVRAADDRFRDGSQFRFLFLERIAKVQERSRRMRRYPWETSKLRFERLKLFPRPSQEKIRGSLAP